MIEQPTLQSKDFTTSIALEGIRIHSKISGFTQDVTVEQRFTNHSKEAIEAVYTYPLPDDAVVHSLEIHKNDSVLYGELDTNEKAQDLYQDVISDGNSAYLMESHRPDIFSTLVGNLGPGETVCICIGYLSKLKPMDDELRLSFPSTVAPRYVSQSTKGLEAEMDADFINPPHAAKVPYGQELLVEIDDAFPMQSVESPTHTLSVSEDDEQTTIRLKDGEAEMSKDIVLKFALERQETPVALSTKGPDGLPYVSLTFYPEIECSQDSAGPTETIFVLDASYSMYDFGNSYGQAQKALELSLRSLRVGDTFNIIRFGSSFEKWKKTPQVYSESTLSEALDYVKVSNYDLGGTELYAPLEDLFRQLPPEGIIRQVLLLTDGQVSNENEIHKLAKAHSSNHRIFTFGIGSAASRFLVKGIAEATGGVAEFIADNERIEPVVLRTFSRMASPMIQDLQLEITGEGSIEHDIGTHKFLPIFDGDAYVVHTHITSGTPKEAALQAVGPEGPLVWKAEIKDLADGVAGSIDKFWASEKIRTLESNNDDLEERSSYSVRKKNRRENRIVELSKKHHILSRQTSFVAVEYRSPQDRLDGNPALQRIPVQLPEQSDSEPMLYDSMPVAGAIAASAPRKGMFAFKRAPRNCLASPPPAAAAFDYDLSEDFEECNDFDDSTESYSCSEPMMSSTELSSDFDKLSDLLSLQKANGSFLPLPSSEINQDDIFSILESEGIEPQAEVLDTLVVLVQLHTEFKDSFSLWKRAAKKAVVYLNQNLGNAITSKLLAQVVFDHLYYS